MMRTSCLGLYFSVHVISYASVDTGARHRSFQRRLESYFAAGAVCDSRERERETDRGGGGEDTELIGLVAAASKDVERVRDAFGVKASRSRKRLASAVAAAAAAAVCFTFIRAPCADVCGVASRRVASCVRPSVVIVSSSTPPRPPLPNYAVYLFHLDAGPARLGPAGSAVRRRTRISDGY